MGHDVHLCGKLPEVGVYYTKNVYVNIIFLYRRYIDVITAIISVYSMTSLRLSQFPYGTNWPSPNMFHIKSSV